MQVWVANKMVGGGGGGGGGGRGGRKEVLSVYR